jgi:TatD DNase family protein
VIDTHCHLCHKALLAQLDAVLQRARDAGVSGVLCAAGDLAEAAQAAQVAAATPGVWCMAGVHPHAAADAPADMTERLRQLAAAPRSVAIGEIGLDYHYDYSPRNVQRAVFERQLALAAELAKPVVVHTREAFDDTLAILRASGIDGQKVIFHSFTEPPAAADAALDFGAAISFSGIVTFKNADELRRSAAMTPDDRLLIETDCPYLSPEPLRKVRTNEPANVAHVAACLARLRGSTPREISDLTAANASRIFALGL